MKNDKITSEMKDLAEGQIRELQKEISFDTKDYPIEVLVDKFREDDFYIPEYQRKFVWDNAKKVRFIESVLLEMDRKATDISGNLDADKIRQICSDHGITYTIDSTCRGGVVLEDVKNKRNQLAHGTTSFAECGRYYAIDDLEKIKNETVIFLNGILQGMKKYYDEKTFLKVVNS